MPIDAPDDPGPLASQRERERYLRDMERWATEGQRLSDEPGDHLQRNLERLERRHQRFLDIHSPIKAAVWLALLRPAHELLADPSPDPENPKSGIVALGEVIARRALNGDVNAFNSIADRIEGKVGLRKGDLDPDADMRQREVGQMITGVVEALTEAGLAGRFVDATVVETTPAPQPGRANRDAPVDREHEPNHPVDQANATEHPDDRPA